MKRSTIFGLLALGSTLTYLWLRKTEGEDELSGVEINVNPTKLVDSVLNASDIKDGAKMGIRHVAHRALNRYMGLGDE